MKYKIKTIFSIVLIGIMFGAIPAVAEVTIRDVFWTPGQSPDNFALCTSNEKPYLHWILTGVDKTEAYTLNLILKGNLLTIDEDVGARAGQSGTYHFYTGFFDPKTITSAYVLDVPGGNNLVISHGCTGTPIPEFPTVALPIAAIIGLVFFFQQRKTKGGK